jgi:hypothetical protein
MRPAFFSCEEQLYWLFLKRLHPPVCFFLCDTHDIELRRHQCIWIRVWPPPPISRLLCTSQSEGVKADLNSITMNKPGVFSLSQMMKNKYLARVFGIPPPFPLAMADNTGKQPESLFPFDQDKLLGRSLCRAKMALSKENSLGGWEVAKTGAQGSEEAAIIHCGRAMGSFLLNPMGGSPPLNPQSAGVDTPQYVGCAETMHSPTDQRREETLKQVFVGLWFAHSASEQDAIAKMRAGFPTHKQLVNRSAVAERPEMLRRCSQLRT